MNKFSKNIAKEFKHSFGRFVAIMAIVAVGVGFLIGVMQATPDMKRSMDQYYRENNAYDIDIKGTLGLTDDDVLAIGATVYDGGGKFAEEIMPVVSTDAIVSVSEKEIVGRVVGLDFSKVKDGTALNMLTLEKGGRFPEAAGEVVVERGNHYFEDVQVGDKITLDKESGQYGDVYTLDSFTVVGVVSSPDYYFKDGREVSAIGTGVVGTVIYCQAYDSAEGKGDGVYDLSKGGLFSALDNDMLGTDSVIRYTDCYVKLAGTEDYETFSDKYKTFVLDAADALSGVMSECNEKLNADVEKVNQAVAMTGGDAIPQSSWYLLDRASTNVSYVSFALNAEKVEDIAGIFPVFFIVVAALVALTSMTRMVEEDRMQIGTFKALGYRNGRIMTKYLLYCCLASFIGCVAGILIGFSLLPSIFWKAYATMYYLPKLSLLFSPWFALAVFGIALAGTALVTFFACRSSLKEKPAVLMQPKAPKPGKRILLERVGFFWNRLKFKWKATVRNIFRYKKNMILTIVSVMGCTALILTGFGLNDSVKAVEEIHFKEIIKYDTVIEYDSSKTSENDELGAFLKSEGASYVSLYGENGQLLMGKNYSSRESIELYAVGEDSMQEFSSFVELRTRKKSAIIELSGGGIVIPENLATVYGVKKGDIVQYVSASGTRIEIPVAAVCEYYTGSVAYISKEYFASLVGTESLTDNTCFVISGIEGEDAQNAATEKLLTDARVSSVSFKSSGLETFTGLSSTMGLVIAVLVISAGALAAIVLYNLTNINIDERRREIATLRVLGYKKYEVAGYIYRESAILTIAGTLLGLLLGFFLHLFIVKRVDSVMMMFGRTIGGLSYLWSFLLTVLFAVIVYAFMLIKLNRINMADSLKSNE